jgi:cytochrome P450
LTQDHQLGGKTIKKGTGVVIFAPFFHRDNEKLDFANKMAPDIWMDKEALLSDGLVPFSAGPAMCPGHNLVPMVASLFIDRLLSEASITLVEPSLDPNALPGTLNNFEVKLRCTRRMAGAA